MRDPNSMCGRQRGGHLDDDPSGPARIERPGGEHVTERLAGRPLHNDIGVVEGILDIKDLRQPGVGEPAGRAGRSYHLGGARKAGCEREYSDGTREGRLAAACCSAVWTTP